MGASLDLAAVELAASDPAALARFYGDQLGLPVTVENGVHVVDVGTTALRIRPATAGAAPFHHLAFAVPENAIAAAHDWLVARGVTPIPVDGDPIVDFPAWNAHAVYFEDPAGNLMELIARHDLANADDGPFGADSLLRIDEVGLPTTDLPAVVAELGARLGARPYGSGSASFQAVGDAGGLAIVVAAGRGWFPTGRPAEPSPVSLVLRGAGRPAFTLPGGPYTVAVGAG